MQINQITPRYHVAPQISVEDIPALRDAGFTTVICNRPDAEVPPSHQAAAIEMAVRAAGLEFELLPLTHQTMTAENIARQAELVSAAPGQVLAYCASGTRCSVIWALGQAGTLSTDEILAATTAAGYDLSGLRTTLDSLA
ncbi:TIGR01244 family sulfur transferase [Puniceibacterium sp. IMCC21224]|uniref:TIGR01244 family sulfur transferase n=1 Tax=Puniceibacterium sp. IMCC21224 TaxID=1618204 RepID=UPI00064D97A8|nr:TIGR01244 family sulfur transferase [Puniceibacterium sp. IMCC21224]KMK66517.1 TIGR01244 family protein [Puniceibacterium sp. IMCC21224]